MSDPSRLPLTVTQRDGSLVIAGEVPTIEAWATVTKKQMDDLPRAPGLYALFHEGTLVYVGESDNIQERVLAHKHSKGFDKVAWLRVDGAQRLLLEKLFIWHHLPSENKEPKRHDHRMALKQLYKEGIP
jgi:hypothetical protein